MAVRLKAKDFLTSKHLLTTWRKIRRRLILVWRDIKKMPHGIDMTKPVHLVVIGVIVGGLIAPVAEWVYTNEQYRLTASVKAVAEKPSPTLMSKLKYDSEKKASVFNAEGAAEVKESAKDQNRTTLGSGGKKDTQLYTATMPDDAARGIEISDNASGVSFKFVPQMSLMGGRTENGHVVYPMKDQAGRMIFTPKGNGVKEDIVLDHSPGSDSAEFAYRLDVPKYVEPRLDDDGGLGFYTASPELFGNISYGTDKDRENVDRARTNAKKTYLMFKIPAPTIRETGGSGNVAGHFTLSGDTLTVRVAGLEKAGYPIAIDPTFYITSTTDFILGSIDDNIDLSVADQVGRQALVGGSTHDWNPTSAPNLAYAQFSAGLVAYNGYLYLIGGGADCTTWTNSTTCSASSTSTATTEVMYICLNPNTGALGTNGGCTPANWTLTSQLNTARQGLSVYGYNGYLYAVGGESTTGVPITAANSVEFAKLNSDGSVGTWNYTGHLNSARSYLAGATYQGVLYAMGGSTGTLNATPTNSTEYARINGDGTIGSCDATTYHTACTWTTSSSFTTSRNRFKGTAYNGYVYIGGGRTSTPTVLNDIQYAAIGSDGSLGTWQTTTPFPTARRDLGFSVNNGYLYVYGGSQQAAMAAPLGQMLGDTYYAVINADGTIGQWQETLNYNTGGYNARVPGGTTFYSNHLYFIGGCYNEAAVSGNHCTNGLVGTFITSIDPVGRFDKGIATTASPPYSGTSTVARSGAQAVALNGYMYYISGCSTSACSTLDPTVEYAAINADGSLGNFATTTALPAGTGAAGRLGHTVVAYNNKLYVIGGVERPKVPSVTSVTPTTIGTAATPHNIGMPGTVVAGDLLLVLLTTSGNNTVTTPGGWSSVATSLNAGSTVRSSVFAKSAAGTEGGTNVNFVTSGNATAAAQVYRIPTGEWQGTVGSAVSASTAALSNGTTAPNPASLTPSWGSANNLWLAYTGGLGYTSTTTYPTNYTNGTHTTTGTGGTNSSVSSGYRYTEATAEDPGAFAMANSVASVTYTVAVQPAAIADIYTSNTLSVTQNSDGTLGSWAAEAQTLPAARAFHTSAVWHNFIYVLGGRDSGTAYGTVYYSQIGSSGALGAWSTWGSTMQARWGHSGGIWGNWLYVVGGMSTATGTYSVITYTSAANAIQKLTINNDGSLSSTVASYASGAGTGDRRVYMGGFVDRGFLYTFGGNLNATATPNRAIYWSALDATTGAPGTPVATNIGDIAGGTMGLDTARSMSTAVAYGGYIYMMGGCTGGMSTTNFRACTGFVSTANTSEVDLPGNGGTGQIGAFTTGSSNVVDLPTVGGTAGRADHATVAYNNKLYVIGGCRLYTAGACSTGLGDIQRADIETDGTITSSWTAQTSLPSGAVRSGLRAVAYNGFLYVMGGRSAGAAATNDVWYTTIDNTGTLGGSWTAGTMPVTRRDFGAAISNGFLYVVGGIDNSAVRQATVYMAAVNADGSLGTWTTTTSFTTARTDFGFLSYNGVLYVVGGYDGTNTLTDVQYADLASNGTISSWAYTTDIARGARARQAVAANGYMYFIGDEGASNTDVMYTTINANGSLGTIQRSPTTMNGAHAHGAVAFYDGYIYATGGCTLSSGVCDTVTAANDRGGQQAISRTGHYSKLFDTQVDTTPTQLVVNGVNSGPGSLVEFRFQTASTGDPVLGVAQLIRPVVYGQFYNVQALNSSGAYVGQAFQYSYIITLDDSRSGTFPDVAKPTYTQTAVTDVTLYYHANPARRLRHGASFTNSGCNDNAADGCILDTAP